MPQETKPKVLLPYSTKKRGKIRCVTYLSTPPINHEGARGPVALKPAGFTGNRKQKQITLWQKRRGPEVKGGGYVPPVWVIALKRRVLNYERAVISGDHLAATKNAFFPAFAPQSLCDLTNVPESFPGKELASVID